MLSTCKAAPRKRTSDTTDMAERAQCTRILIMSASDSDAVFLSHMVQILSYGDTVIDTVDRLSIGADRLRGGKFDVVLMDLNLLDAAGLDSFAKLVTLAPRVPIVVVVGMEDEEWAQEAIRRGAQDYQIREQVTPHTLAHSLKCAVERHRQLLELRDISMTDPLTGLLNRRGFWSLADSHMRVTRRHRKRSLLLSADLDGLKEINDTHGHDEGDRAITRAAALLQSCFRDSDVVARFGGDEFVALAFDVDENGEAALRQKIEDCLRRANKTGESTYEISMSVGTTVVTGHESNLHELLRESDQALYREKAKRPSGRFSAQMATKTKAKGRQKRSSVDVLAMV